MDVRKDKYIVDRIEDGGLVVCEYNGEMFNFDISLFPSDVREGDLLVFGETSFEYDTDAKIDVKKRISQKSKNLFK